MKASKTEQPTQFYAFDSFLVDAPKSMLLRNGQSVPLTPKAFKILLVLVRNPGRALKKEELMEQVWPDAFVDENNLPRNISSLRKALGEGPAEHKYIVILPGQGYACSRAENSKLYDTPLSVAECPAASAAAPTAIRVDIATSRNQTKQDQSSGRLRCLLWYSRAVRTSVSGVHSASLAANASSQLPFGPDSRVIRSGLGR